MVRLPAKVSALDTNKLLLLKKMERLLFFILFVTLQLMSLTGFSVSHKHIPVFSDNIEESFTKSETDGSNELFR